MKRYSDELVQFIAANAKGTRYEKLAGMVNEKFGTSFSGDNLRSWCVRHKYYNGLGALKSDEIPHLFSQEMLEWARTNVKGLSLIEFTDLLNKTFKTDYTTGQVDNWKSREHLNSGLTGYFEKGHIPQNKGKKMAPEIYEKCKATMFKKGNIPKQHRPVGSERVLQKDGYIEVKIADPNVWELKHRLIWKQYYGEIPENHNIIFLDGNIRNFDITNLACISRSVSAMMSRNKLWNEKKELTKTGTLVAELMLKTARSKKKKGK